MKSLFRVRWLFIASSESTLNTRKREHKIPLLFDFYFNTKIWRDHKNREKTKSESFSGAFNFDKDRIDQNISIVRCSYFIWEMLQMLIYCSKWTENAELGMIAWNVKQRKNKFITRARKTKAIKKVRNRFFLEYLISHVSAHLIVCPDTK